MFLSIVWLYVSSCCVDSMKSGTIICLFQPFCIFLYPLLLFNHDLKVCSEGHFMFIYSNHSQTWIKHANDKRYVDDGNMILDVTRIVEGEVSIQSESIVEDYGISAYRRSVELVRTAAKTIKPMRRQKNNQLKGHLVQGRRVHQHPLGTRNTEWVVGRTGLEES